MQLHPFHHSLKQEIEAGIAGFQRMDEDLRRAVPGFLGGLLEKSQVNYPSGLCRTVMS